MSTEEYINKITDLTEQWYKLISPEHHKTRDCFWYIVTKWAFGKKPVYVVEHHGYICEAVDVTCSTYEEALKQLVSELEKAIAVERQHQQLDNG